MFFLVFFSLSSNFLSFRAILTNRLFRRINGNRFYFQLFLLHMDDIMPIAAEQKNSINEPVGCSTICVNQPNCVMRHRCIFFIFVCPVNEILYFLGNSRSHWRCTVGSVKSFLFRFRSHNQRYTTRKIQSHWREIYVVMLCRPFARLHDELQSSWLGIFH